MMNSSEQNSGRRRRLLCRFYRGKEYSFLLLVLLLLSFHAVPGQTYDYYDDHSISHVDNQNDQKLTKRKRIQHQQQNLEEVNIIQSPVVGGRQQRQRRRQQQQQQPTSQFIVPSNTQQQGGGGSSSSQPNDVVVVDIPQPSGGASVPSRPGFSPPEKEAIAPIDSSSSSTTTTTTTEVPSSSPTTELSSLLPTTTTPMITPMKSPSAGPTTNPTTKPTTKPTTNPATSRTETPTTEVSESLLITTEQQQMVAVQAQEQEREQQQQQSDDSNNSNNDFLPTADLQEEDREEMGLPGSDSSSSSFSSNQREPNTTTNQAGNLIVVEREELELVPEAENVDPTDADQFLPAADPTYYFVELRPFSVFVTADRDLTSDLGIPLYLLLKMGEQNSLSTLVDIKITNLTIHMGVVMTDVDDHLHDGENEEDHVHNLLRHRRRRRLGGSNHYHWNQLFFHGLAQFDDSVRISPATVQAVQSLVLMDGDKLQQFWDEQQRSDLYSGIELQNITLLPFLPPPTEPPAAAPTTAPPPLPTTSTTEEEEVDEDSSTTSTPTSQEQEATQPTQSKRESNVWVMVPLVLLFFFVCLCLILLAGRLQYLGSRAQDKYNEKYGLDYNVYDKDIGKEIFKEEYLMSEHQDDKDLSLSNSDHHVRSIDLITKSIKVATRSSFKQQQINATNDKRLAQEEQSTEEEEEETQEQGSFTGEGLVRKVSSPAEEERNNHMAYGSPNNIPMSGGGRNESNRKVDRIPAEKERHYSSNERGYQKKNNVVVDEGIIIPKVETVQDKPQRYVPDRMNHGHGVAVESVPPDEDDHVALKAMPQMGHPIEVGLDNGDPMPSLLNPPGTTMMVDTGDLESNTSIARSGASVRRRNSNQRRGSKEVIQGMGAGMGSSQAARDRSYRNRGGSGGSFSGSFNAGDAGNVMGNSSRGSRSGNRSSSRFNRSSGSFTGNAGDEANALGGSGRGDRSIRSNRSNRSESSMGSFYSCQGDLV